MNQYSVRIFLILGIPIWYSHLTSLHLCKGTNPIAFGIPLGSSSTGESRQLVFDMASSAEAYFGIMLASMANTQIKADVAYDSQGRETTNPHEALKGALRVFDRGHKGSGIALMIELLAGALTGASMESKLENANWGTLIIAINPNILGNSSDFIERCNVMCQRVKSAKSLDDSSRIFLPGERGDELERKNLAKGCLEISRSIHEKLVKYVD